MGMKEGASQGLNEIQEEAKVIKGDKSKHKKYSSHRDFSDEESAKNELTRCKERLFDVNSWSDIPGIANASFELHGADGQPLRKKYPEIGDFVKIDLPGPLPFFWVRVIDMTTDDDMAQFIVQPSHDPADNQDKTTTKHFFRDQARSIFRVERHGSQITAMEIGLNESINNRETEAGGKAVINTLVSEGGWAGFQKYQWQNLTDYIVGHLTPASQGSSRW
jgi:hypothetical protein